MTTNDDKPIVIFTAEQDAEYEIKVTMPGCHANRFCHLGVAVFGQWVFALELARAIRDAGDGTDPGRGSAVATPVRT